MAKEQFMVRMPDGLRAQIAESARLNNRSMNQEVVLLIQRGLGLMPMPDTVPALPQHQPDLFGTPAAEDPVFQKALRRVVDEATQKFRQTLTEAVLKNLTASKASD